MSTSATRRENEVIGRERDRVFLVVLDDSEELAAAIRYACNRARHTGGRVALLYVIDTETGKDFQHWHFVGNLMEQEAEQQARDALSRYSAQIFKDSGTKPDQYIRKGNQREELFALVHEHPEISILVLGSAPGEKPGPLVEAVTGKFAGQIGIPVTVIPGSLPMEEIDRLT